MQIKFLHFSIFCYTFASKKKIILSQIINYLRYYFIMNIEIIGNNAGLVWNALSTKNGQTVKELKKTTKIKTDKVLFAALGWLAREGKLSIEETEEDLIVTLL